MGYPIPALRVLDGDGTIFSQNSQKMIATIRQAFRLGGVDAFRNTDHTITITRGHGSMTIPLDILMDTIAFLTWEKEQSEDTKLTPAQAQRSIELAQSFVRMVYNTQIIVYHMDESGLEDETPNPNSSPLLET